MEHIRVVFNECSGYNHIESVEIGALLDDNREYDKTIQIN